MQRLHLEQPEVSALYSRAGYDHLANAFIENPNPQSTCLCNSSTSPSVVRCLTLYTKLCSLIHSSCAPGIMALSCLSLTLYVTYAASKHESHANPSFSHAMCTRMPFAALSYASPFTVVPIIMQMCRALPSCMAQPTLGRMWRMSGWWCMLVWSSLGEYKDWWLSKCCSPTTHSCSLVCQPFPARGRAVIVQ